MKRGIEKLIKKHFPLTSGSYFFYVFGEEGIPVYSNSNSDDNQSIGVLVSGSMKALEHLVQISGLPSQKNQDEEFRFSYATSDTGLLINDFKVEDRNYFFVTKFTKEKNPGKLRSKIRLLIFDLATISLPKSKVEKNKDTKQLFTNITDKEVDNMFSSLGI